MWLIIGLFFCVDLVILFAIGLCAYEGIRYFKYGNPQIKFDAFPFQIGGSLKLRLPINVHNFETVTLSLRHILEEHEIKGENYVYKFFQELLEDRIYLGKDLKGLPELEIDWPLPDKQDWGTCLSERPSRYWELEVKAQTSGPDYHARFLLPVYAKS